MKARGSILHALLIPFVILIGCIGVALDSGETKVRFSVIASGGTFPPEFWERATDDVLIRVAADEDAFRELWLQFRFSATPEPAPRWEDEVVLFLATGESSNCPLSVRDVTFNSRAGRLTIHLKPRVEGQGACVADFRSRTFALTLPRTLLQANWREVQVVGAARNPTVPVPTLHSRRQS